MIQDNGWYRNESDTALRDKLADDFPIGTNDASFSFHQKILNDLSLSNTRVSIDIGAYTGAQILVVPSRKEAMSIVAIEAGACGTPVLLTTEGGFDEIKEVGCKIVPPNADELYKELYNTFYSEKNLTSLGSDFRNFVLDRYTWKMTTQKYLELKLNS